MHRSEKEKEKQETKNGIVGVLLEVLSKVVRQSDTIL